MKKTAVIGIIMALSAQFAVGIQAAENKLELCNENFESYAEGTKLSETGLGWTVNDDKAGDKVTIEKDTVSNSKAVRIEQTKQEPNTWNNKGTGFILDGFGDKITEGIVDISFKIRREFGGAALPLGFLGIDNGYRWWQCNSDIYLGGWKNYGGKINTEYTEWKITYDFANGKIKINDFTEEKNPGGYSGLQFLIAGNYGDGASSWLNGVENVNPVYWIDDIVVKRHGVSLNNSSIDEAAENVSVEKSVSLTFDKDIKSDKITDNIKIYENNSLKTNYNVSVDGKKMEITFPDKLEYNSSYRIEIAKIEATEKGNLPFEDYVLNFKTERLFEKIAGLSDGGKYATKTIILPQKDNVEISAKLENSKGEIEDYISGTEITEKDEYTLTVTGKSSVTGKSQTDIYKFKVVGELAPIAENVKITLDGDLITKNATLTGSYEFTDVNEDKEGESLLRWYSADTENGKYTLISEKKKSDNVNTYTLTEKDMNKYIKFAVVPVSERVPYNGDEVFSQCIAGFFEPVAETVAITGKAELGEKLSAQYLYTDRNGYTEISPKYRWYRQKDNEKPVIIDGEESAEYIVSENDSDCDKRAGI